MSRLTNERTNECAYSRGLHGLGEERVVQQLLGREAMLGHWVEALFEKVIQFVGDLDRQWRHLGILCTYATAMWNQIEHDTHFHIRTHNSRTHLRDLEHGRHGIERAIRRETCQHLDHRTTETPTKNRASTSSIIVAALLASNTDAPNV
mgnify:CR=1 FL=1